MAYTTVTGNLTGNPTLRFSAAGKAIAGFRLAENYQARGEAEPEVLYITCTAFGPMAERVAELSSGDRMVASGRLVTKSWTSQEGEKRSAVELIVNDCGASLLFGERSGKSGAAPAGKPGRSESGAASAAAEEPF
jgi:single-strand DNA-binding protein